MREEEGEGGEGEEEGEGEFDQNNSCGIDIIELGEDCDDGNIFTTDSCIGKSQGWCHGRGGGEGTRWGRVPLIKVIHVALES